MVYVQQVKVATVLAGTVDSFDQAAYKVSMAALFSDVEPEDITLNVTSASVRVEATITTKSESQADSVSETIETYPPASLSTALDVVERVEEPVPPSRL